MTQSRPVALITGGRRGIGRGIAYALADVGFDIVANDVEANGETETTRAGVQQRGAGFHFIQADVAAIDGHESLVDEAWSTFGRLDCLVNNAGVGALHRGDILDVSPESYDRCLSINLRGAFFLTQAVVRRMLTERSSEDAHRSIINISSANAEVPALNRAEYCVSKAAMAMQSKLFALRLAQTDIAVFEIRPGIIATPLTAPVADDYTRRINEGLTPVPRWGQPEDVGRVAATAATGGLPFTVGEVIRVDGGLCTRTF